MNLKGERPERFGAVTSLLYRRWAEPMLLPLYRRVGAEVPIEKGKLLDIGCGPGRLARLLAASRPELQVVGLDPSPAMLRQARRGPMVPNLDFREGPIETVDSVDEFDFLLSVLSFHHWEEPVKGLRAAYRSLKPGGRFWIYEPDPEASDGDLRADFAPLWGWLRLPAGFRRRVFRRHGFSHAEAEAVVRPAIEQTLFRDLRISRTGSTLRLALAKES